MFKKILALTLAVFMFALTMAAFSGCGKNSGFKVGVILIGDDSEGYTKAHMDGIAAAAKKLDIPEKNIIYKTDIPEGAECTVAAEDLVDRGCKLIISNSYGHQEYMEQVAQKNKDVDFIAMTGDYAALTGLDNFFNAFTDIYEARYVSGVVAGMKIKQLLDDNLLTSENKDSAGNVKVGYVGAKDLAEVISGYTAFYLGIKSVVSNVVMDVKFTGSWFDIDLEKSTAAALISNGCVIIGQHADSTGAPQACQDAFKAGKQAYSVGYNVSMLEVAADAALTSATNVWEVYYEQTLKASMDGGKPVQNWSKGYADGSVAITELGKNVAPGTEAKVTDTINGLKDGSIKVFDTDKFTVGGEKVTTHTVDLTRINFATGDVLYAGEKKEAIKDGQFAESTLRAAPYFGLTIDGITKPAANS